MLKRSQNMIQCNLGTVKYPLHLRCRAKRPQDHPFIYPPIGPRILGTNSQIRRKYTPLYTPKIYPPLPPYITHYRTQDIPPPLHHINKILNFYIPISEILLTLNTQDRLLFQNPFFYFLIIINYIFNFHERKFI